MQQPEVLTIYRGHREWVSTLSWLPDGRHIVSGSADGTVQLWESDSGKNVLMYNGHSLGVTAVACSPDGSSIASASLDTTVQVWDAQSGKTQTAYRGHSAWIRRALAWSPHGRRIASGSWDRTVQVWDAFSGEDLLTYRGHEGVVCAVAWSPDGRYLASGGGIPDKSVQVWHAEAGERLLSYREHLSSVHSVRWMADGKRILSGGARSHACLWEVTTGKTLALYYYSDETGLVWSPDEQYFLCQTHGMVEIWVAHSDKCVYRSPSQMYKINAMSWSPDGTRIAFGGHNKTVVVWNVEPLLAKS